MYIIKHHGEKRRWVQLTGVDDDHPDGTSWTLVDGFNRLCLLDEEQARAFLDKPGVDPRYRGYRVRMQFIDDSYFQRGNHGTSDEA